MIDVWQKASQKGQHSQNTGCFSSPEGTATSPAGKPTLAVPKEVTMTYWSMPSATAASTSAIAPSPSIFFGLLKLSASLSGAPIACTTCSQRQANLFIGLKG